MNSSWLTLKLRPVFCPVRWTSSNDCCTPGKGTHRSWQPTGSTEAEMSSAGTPNWRSWPAGYKVSHTGVNKIIDNSHNFSCMFIKLILNNCPNIVEVFTVEHLARSTWAQKIFYRALQRLSSGISSAQYLWKSGQWWTGIRKYQWSILRPVELLPLNSFIECAVGCQVCHALADEIVIEGNLSQSDWKVKQRSCCECSLGWLTRGAQATTNKTTTTQEESIWVRPRLANILREKLVNALGKHCKK